MVTDRSSETSGEQPTARPSQSPADSRPTEEIPQPQPEVSGPPAVPGLGAEAPAFGQWTSPSNMHRRTEVLRLRVDPSDAETLETSRPVTLDDAIDETVPAPLPAPRRPPAPGPRPPRVEQGPPAPGPTNWSYVESFRTSELVPTRKLPAGRGWRRALYRASFGLINLRAGPGERRPAEPGNNMP